MKSLISLLVILIPSFALGQWSVYDEKVYQEIKRINEVSGAQADLDSSFKEELSNSSSGQDLTLGSGSDKAQIRLYSKVWTLSLKSWPLRILKSTLEQNKTVVLAM